MSKKLIYEGFKDFQARLHKFKALNFFFFKFKYFQGHSSSVRTLVKIPSLNTTKGLIRRISIVSVSLIYRECYITLRSYEFYPRVLVIYDLSRISEGNQCEYVLSTRKDKIRNSKRSCNVLFIILKLMK